MKKNSDPRIGEKPKLEYSLSEINNLFGIYNLIANNKKFFTQTIDRLPEEWPNLYILYNNSDKKLKSNELKSLFPDFSEETYTKTKEELTTSFFLFCGMVYDKDKVYNLLEIFTFLLSLLAMIRLENELLCDYSHDLQKKTNNSDEYNRRDYLTYFHFQKIELIKNHQGIDFNHELQPFYTIIKNNKEYTRKSLENDLLEIFKKMEIQDKKIVFESFQESKVKILKEMTQIEKENNLKPSPLPLKNLFESMEKIWKEEINKKNPKTFFQKIKQMWQGQITIKKQENQKQIEENNNEIQIDEKNNETQIEETNRNKQNLKIVQNQKEKNFHLNKMFLGLIPIPIITIGTLLCLRFI